MGCHGLSVVTSLLIGDTAKIEDVQIIDADWVADQARVILEDMPVAALKVGIAGSIENIAVIAEIVSDYPDIPLILDPFSTAMPDQGTDADELIIAMRELLLPQTTVLMLSAIEISRFAETWPQSSVEESLAADAARIIDSGCEFVFVTGTPNDVHDVANTLFGQSGALRNDCWPRQAGSFSGAGNTLSATITAMLANGLDVPQAVLEAQEFTNAALLHAQRLGMGKLIPDRFFWAREPEENS